MILIYLGLIGDLAIVRCTKEKRTWELSLGKIIQKRRS
jgi:hypothetical protein